MTRKIITSIWDRVNLLSINDNFTELYEEIRTIIASQLDAEFVLEEARRVNRENTETKIEFKSLK